MSRREAQQLVRRCGGTYAETINDETTLLVVGEQDPASSLESVRADLSAEALVASQQGSLEVISESQFWQRLGLVAADHDSQRWYTAGMLAGLIGEPAATIRRWQRLGWLVPTREVRRLSYFNFEEVATARRIKELLDAGMSTAAIAKTLATLTRQLPGVRRPLAELSIVVQGKQLLVRQASGLVEPGGQLRFDFDSPEDLQSEEASLTATDPVRAERSILLFSADSAAPLSPAEMLQAAADLEGEGHLLAAADMYRAALAAGGPNAEICFLLAELLYQLHDLQASRERYYMAIELDENYVEARANLGCVLAELGERELAVSAFQGALAFHDDYEDAHYHLARTLDELGRGDEALIHWQAFLRLAPSSPWADEARERLGQ